MPSFFKRSKDKEKDAQAERAAVARPATPPPAYGDPGHDLSTVPDINDAPPPFSVSDGKASRPKDISAAFASLKLTTQKDPDVDSCLAHLKLLHAIQTLKDDIGYTDGLWDIWDHRAQPRQDGADSSSATSDPMEILSLIREKRWALYLARAVDRYEAWWNSLPCDPLTEGDMELQGSLKYDKFPRGSEDFPWTQDDLPPLDVLMIWHTHMLNPRAFLEDAMRQGLKTFWTTGMPWAQVNAAIDSKFDYTVSDDCKAKWEQMTGKAWLNQDDSNFKALECPACHVVVELPWTTCGLPELYKGVARPGLYGNGYGDGQFSQFCPAECGTPIDRKTLPVARFLRDAKLSVENSVPMPGSILDPKTGTPKCTQTPAVGYPFAELSFPNRLVKTLYPKLESLIRPGMSQPEMPTMQDVSTIIATALKDEMVLKRIQNPRRIKVEIKPGKFLARDDLQNTERFQCRKMMGRYWQNHSMFALDLAAGALRQGTFIDKMYKIDWLHSPAARSTMTRLIQKYHRFVLIMVTNPGNMAVPTLDVDLAWHTHQLAPRAYYEFTTSRTAASSTKEAKFIDHNDKVEESALSNSFEFTCKKYMEMFNEVYSESVREMHPSSSERFGGKSKGQKAIEELHKSTPPPADKTTATPHMSTHNAVTAVEAAASHWSRRSVRQHSRYVWDFKLQEAYEKAARRAKRRNITLPSKQAYYNHWGKEYYMLGPNVAPSFLNPGMYYSDDAFKLPMGRDAWAQCAQGTCGQNDIAAGACGGPGGCTQASGYIGIDLTGNPGKVSHYGIGTYGGGGGGGCSGGGGGCGGGS